MLGRTFAALLVFAVGFAAVLFAFAFAAADLSFFPMAN